MRNIRFVVIKTIWQMALIVYSRPDWVRSHLGNLYLANSKPKQAIKTWEAISRPTWKCYQNLAQAKILLNDIVGAIADLDRAVTHQRENIKLRAQLCVLLVKNKELSRAEENYEALLLLTPNDSVIWGKYIRLCLKQNKKQKVKTALEQLSGKPGGSTQVASIMAKLKRSSA